MYKMMMHLKFRFYVFLVCCSALVILGLYMLLSTDEESLNNQSKQYVTVSSNYNAAISKPASTKTTLGPMKNVNELLEITQPSHHLRKQKLREAEVHLKMNEEINRRKTQPPGVITKFLINTENMAPIQHKIVHLDLKGAPPLFSYYKSFLPLLKEIKATGILIEYEDMFPYFGSLSDISAQNAYSPTEIKGILSLAKENNLEVIPLIQTFGHLEFTLKLPKYAYLREVPEYPQVVCPSNNDTLQFIKEMIDQIVLFHKDLKWIHIGADEVYYLGRCDKCQMRMQKEHLDLDTLFIHHVTEIAKYIKEKHNIQPIMWDDMFRSISEEDLKNSEIWKHVDLMVWAYVPDVEAKLPEEIWLKYSSVFKNIWAASAFKGATKSNSILPNLNNHSKNHVSWMKVINEYKDKVHFEGIALTGWQRYDHFALLCELLPAGMHSLVLNLLFLNSGTMDEKVIEQASNILKCQTDFNITQEYSNEELFCDFPGSKVFTGVQRLANIQKELEKLKRNSHVNSWITDYHVRMRFGSHAHVEIGTRHLPELILNTTKLYSYMERALSTVYDSFTVKEWLEISIDPIVKELKAIKERADVLMMETTWPRRPLNDPNPFNTLKELAALNRPAGANDL